MTPTPPNAWLEGISPGVKGMRIELASEAVKIGRASTCAVTLSDPLVSREHAQIVYLSGGFAVADLGSSHGTWVDDQKIQEAALGDGSRIRLGTSEFVFRLPQEAIPTAMLGPAGLPPASAEVRPGPGAAAAPPMVPEPVPAPLLPPASQPPPRKAGPSKWLIGCAGLALLAACGCAAVLAVGLLAGGEGGAGETISQLLDQGARNYTSDDLALALSLPSVDERPEILENFGPPDEFEIAIVQVEGGQVRRESWCYYRLGTRVDFVDGVIVWTVDLEPPPQDTVFPAWYAPTDFETGMTVDEVTALLIAASPAGSAPQAFDLSEGGEDLAGLDLLAGDQITVGFEDGILVYVETMGMTLD